MYGIAAASTRHVAAAAGAKRTTDQHSTATVRDATSSEPRSSTFHAACRNAAASARTNASAGTGEERVGECDPELVPAPDLRRRLGAQRRRIVGRVVGVVDPAEHLRVGDL